MTDLHWALLGIAVFLLLALWIYGKWQERRALSRMNTALRQGVGDPLVDARTMPFETYRAAGPRRIEPRLEAESQATSPAPREELALPAGTAEFEPTQP